MSNVNSTETPQDDRVLWEFTKPNWEEWKSVKQAKLWEAVALALNIDPSNFYYFGKRKLDLVFTKRQHPGFVKRLGLAVGNISADGVLKPVRIDLDSPEESEVLFSNFIKWAKSIKAELPPGFPGTKTVLTVKKETSQDENKRTTLLALVATLVNALKIDITKPSKAASLIQDLTIQIGARVAARTIENHLKRITNAVETPLLEREQTTLLVLIGALAKEVGIDILKPTKAASLIVGLTTDQQSFIAISTIEAHLKCIPSAQSKRSS